MKSNKDSILRNLVFGIQDSFGSTVGFLSGVAVSGMSKSQLLFTGVLLIFVEAFSMALGSLISDHSVDERKAKKNLPLFRNMAGAFTMFFAYLISGLIPLLPYLLIWGKWSLIISIFISLFALSFTAWYSAKVFKINVFHHIIEILATGILAILVGLVVGNFYPEL